jgi:DNA-binding CsgD family transcriptional regulator
MQHVIIITLRKTIDMITLNHKNSKQLLSKRELEIVELIAYEHSTKEIANLLYIGFETVKTHRKNIQSKLNVKNAAGIVRAAFQNNLLETNAKLNIAS